MPSQIVPKEQLHAAIVDALAEHRAMHGRLGEIPAHPPISEEWHQVEPSVANWRIAPLLGSSPALAKALEEVTSDLQRCYRLDLPPWGQGA